MEFHILLLCIFPLLSNINGSPSNQFVSVNETQFALNGERYIFIGSNLWYGFNLAADNSEGGDPDRLMRELDRLKDLGMTNLRIMGLTQGTNKEPWRIKPSLQEKLAGEPNLGLLSALDLLLSEMSKREMKAVVCLGNYWIWSGGFAQYVSWAGDTGLPKSIPYFGRRGSHSIEEYSNYTSSFYLSVQAMNSYNKYIKMLLSRVNTVSGVQYKNDPTIMSWQLANEARPYIYKDEYLEWIRNTVLLIKGIDSNHLVSLGSDGTINDPYFLESNGIEGIDYVTFHSWVQTGMYNPDSPDTYRTAAVAAGEYIAYNIGLIYNELHKPAVLEEFGFNRDGNSSEQYFPESEITLRDEFYTQIFAQALTAMGEKKLSGVNVWCWAGEGRPLVPGGVWEEGNQWIGDPPFEPQGWFSIYNRDHSTLDIIQTYIKLLKPAASPATSLHLRAWQWVLIVLMIVLGIIMITFIAIFIRKSSKPVPGRLSYSAKYYKKNKKGKKGLLLPDMTEESTSGEIGLRKD